MISLRPLFTRSSLASLVALTLLVPAASAADPEQTPPRAAALAKLDPKLLDVALAPSSGTHTVWVEFTDKGERGEPGAVAARLAEARASLSPRALARRMRARVQPLVDWQDVPVHAPYLESLAASGAQAIGVSRWFNMAAVRVPADRLIEIAALSHVERLRPVERSTRRGDPAIERPEPLDLSSWAPAPAPARASGVSGGTACLSCQTVDHGATTAMLDQVDVAALHDSGYSGAGVLIAVFDDGFNFWDKHEALRDHVIPLDRQRDFILQRWGVQDTLSGGWRHGTQTFGTIAGRKFGVYVGSAYDASFALARTETDFSETPAEMTTWGLAAEWADSLGVDLISSSLGYSTFDGGTGDYTYADMDGRTTIVSRAAQIAASKGILVVNSVGNEGQTTWHYLLAPSDAHGDSVIAVGAGDAGGNTASFSSYGPSADGRVKPDLCARGVSNPVVAATTNPNAYASASGTSFSAPIVAGAAACLMQARPTWTPREIARALGSTASHPNAPDTRCGYGWMAALAALDYDPVTGVPRPSRSAVLLRPLGANPYRADEGAIAFLLEGTRTGVGQPASVTVLDAGGRRVRTLSETPRCLRAQTLTWDGRDEQDRAVPAGLYFVTFRTSSSRESLRLVLLR